MSATTTPDEPPYPEADGRDQILSDAPSALDGEARLRRLLDASRRELERREYDAAEASCAEALALGMRDLGPDHPALVPCLNQLASVRLARGEFAAASVQLRRVLDISEAHYGAEHESLAGSLSALAHAHLRAGQLAEAEPLLVRLRDIVLRRAASPLEMAAVLESLASLRHAQEEYVAAEQLWRQVVEIRERALPADDPAIATSLERLADTCAARGRARDARPLLERALAMRAHALGAEHPALARLRLKLATLGTAASKPATSARPVLSDAGARMIPPGRESATATPTRTKTSETSVEVLRALVRAREAERESAQPRRAAARDGGTGERARRHRGPMVFAAAVAIAAVLIGALVAGGAVQRTASSGRSATAAQAKAHPGVPAARGSVGGDVATGTQTKAAPGARPR
jgi:tetratricopeptide (TPR) repeat protein